MSTISLIFMQMIVVIAIRIPIAYMQEIRPSVNLA